MSGALSGIANANESGDSLALAIPCDADVVDRSTCPPFREFIYKHEGRDDATLLVRNEMPCHIKFIAGADYRFKSCEWHGCGTMDESIGTGLRRRCF